jgi:mRNA-degrading endonuclease toxin of MazEF toxin-antitoxin module
MKLTREQRFWEAVERERDEAYKAWLIANKPIFVTRPRTQKKAWLDALAFEDSTLEGLEGVTIKKGEIYYADLDPAAKGKVRPVLIWQNDKLNRAVALGIYHQIIVMPLSSRLYGGLYRFRIEAREKLPKTSEVVCNAIGLVGSNRLMPKRGMLTKVTDDEAEAITRILLDIFG